MHIHLVDPSHRERQHIRVHLIAAATVHLRIHDHGSIRGFVNDVRLNRFPPADIVIMPDTQNGDMTPETLIAALRGNPVMIVRTMRVLDLRPIPLGCIQVPFDRRDQLVAIATSATVNRYAHAAL